MYETNNEMGRIFRLNSKQVELLKESNEDYVYVDGENTVPEYNGLSQIGVNGKISKNEYGDPTDEDEYSSSLSPQFSWRMGNGAYYIKPVREGKEDTNQDGVDDFYNHNELDTLNNDTSNDNLVKIPDSVQHRVDMLINDVKKANLSQKQQAIVLNKIIEVFGLKDLPYSWKKELRLKINT